MTVCQLHGGDIGVSSKDGEGSTFGFFFKVRRSKGEDGRPLFQSRSNSETNQPLARSQTPRPGYSRANSNLQSIKETQNSRPGAKTLTSHRGVDTDNISESLKNPPTEFRAEAHPESSEDARYKETERIASQVQSEQEKTEKKTPNFHKGETRRQRLSAEKTSESQSHAPSKKHQTLLLVEDNLINQKVLRRQLQSRGFQVFVANNGQEAIDAVAERGKTAESDPNNCNYFDCILMDQEMPIKDGNTATQEIRKLQEEGKAGYSAILGVSANVRADQTKSMLEAGMDDVISKPFKVDDLVKRIRGLISLDNEMQESCGTGNDEQNGIGKDKQSDADRQVKKEEQSHGQTKRQEDKGKGMEQSNGKEEDKRSGDEIEKVLNGESERKQADEEQEKKHSIDG